MSVNKTINSFVFGDHPSLMDYSSTSRGIRIGCVPNTFISFASTSETTLEYYMVSRFYRGNRINGYIMYEPYPGAFTGQHSQGNNYRYQTSTLSYSIGATGVKNTATYRRLVCDVPLRGGVRFGGFHYICGSNATTPNGGLYEGVNTGTSGLISFTINVGFMALNGTMTQFATATQTLNLTGSAQYVPIEISDNTTATSVEGDVIYFEFIGTIAQTARTSGTNPVGFIWHANSVYNITSTSIPYSMEFYLR